MLTAVVSRRAEPGRAAVRRGGGRGGAAAVGGGRAAVHAGAPPGAGGAAGHGAPAALDRPGVRLQADRPARHRRRQRVPALRQYKLAPILSR